MFLEKTRNFLRVIFFYFLILGLNVHQVAKNYATLTQLGVNSIQGTGVLNKNRLRKCTIIVDKQLQKRQRSHFEQRTSSKEAVQC